MVCRWPLVSLPFSRWPFSWWPSERVFPQPRRPHWSVSISLFPNHICKEGVCIWSDQWGEIYFKAFVQRICRVCELLWYRIVEALWCDWVWSAEVGGWIQQRTIYYHGTQWSCLLKVTPPSPQAPPPHNPWSLPPCTSPSQSMSNSPALMFHWIRTPLLHLLFKHPRNMLMFLNIFCWEFSVIVFKNFSFPSNGIHPLFQS